MQRRFHIAPQLRQWRQAQLKKEFLRRHPHSLCEGWVCQLQFSHVLDSHTCIGYLVYPFLKMRSEQRISIGLVGNFLKVYVSILDFLQ
jgi:hypothetical protein